MSHRKIVKIKRQIKEADKENQTPDQNTGGLLDKMTEDESTVPSNVAALKLIKELPKFEFKPVITTKDGQNEENQKKDDDPAAEPKKSVFSSYFAN